MEKTVIEFERDFDGSECKPYGEDGKKYLCEINSLGLKGVDKFEDDAVINFSGNLELGKEIVRAFKYKPNYRYVRLVKITVNEEVIL